MFNLMISLTVLGYPLKDKKATGFFGGFKGARCGVRVTRFGNQNSDSRNAQHATRTA